MQKGGVPVAFSSDTKYGLRHPAAASHPLASRWPQPQQQLPVSATGGGRCCCKPFHRPPYCPAGNRVPPQRTVLRETSRRPAGTDAAVHYDPFGENVFGAARRPRQTQNKNNSSAEDGQSAAEAILIVKAAVEAPLLSRFTVKAAHPHPR